MTRSTPPFSEIEGEENMRQFSEMDFSERQKLPEAELRRQAEDFLLGRIHDKFAEVSASGMEWAAKAYPRQFAEFIRGAPATDEEFPAPPGEDDKSAEDCWAEAVSEFAEKNSLSYDAASTEMKTRNPSLWEKFAVESTRGGE